MILAADDDEFRRMRENEALEQGSVPRVHSWRPRRRRDTATKDSLCPVRFVNSHGLADVAYGLMIATVIILFLYMLGLLSNRWRLWRF
jgi:hypothetical protein